MSVDICYVLSFGFAARTVLHTQLVPELKQRGLSVAAIAPGANEPALRAMGEKQGIALFQAPKVVSRFLSYYLPRRRYLLEDIRNNPALWARYQRDLEITGSFKHRIKLLGHSMQLRCLYALNRLIRLTSAHRLLTPDREQRLFRHDEVRALLQEIRPKLLVSTYPVDPLEAIALAEAKRLGIKTVVQLLSWDNITSKGRFPVLADHYLSWGPIMTQELREHYGLGLESVTETGVAHFDAHVTRVDTKLQEQILKEMKLASDSPSILFGMSSPYFAPQEIEIVEDLATRIIGNEFGNRISLVVRPHPQNVRGYMADQTWLPRLRALQGPRVAISWPKLLESDMNWAVEESDLDELVNLMGRCSININSGSTFAIDGLAHNKPVILTFFDGSKDLPWHHSAKRGADYVHNRKLIETGGVFPVYSFPELHKRIHQLLKEPDLNQQSRTKAFTAECVAIDGRSCLRIAERLAGLVSASAPESSSGGLSPCFTP